MSTSLRTEERTTATKNLPSFTLAFKHKVCREAVVHIWELWYVSHDPSLETHRTMSYNQPKVTHETLMMGLEGIQATEEHGK